MFQVKQKWFFPPNKVLFGKEMHSDVARGLAVGVMKDQVMTCWFIPENWGGRAIKDLLSLPSVKS